MVLNEDGLLAEAIKAGYTQRFEELVDKYKDMVYNMARHITGCPHEAEDLSQEIFLLIYNNIHGFQGKSSLSTWIYRITLNRCLDWQRKQQRKRKYVIPLFQKKEEFSEDPLERLASHHPTPEEELISKEKIQELRGIIQRLPEKYQKVMILYYYQQMSYSEIAEVLDIPAKTVETQLYRGRQKIREQLTGPEERGVKAHEFA